MKRFNASKVRALGNLAPLSEKQKAFARRVRGISKPFSHATGPAEITKPKARNFLAPTREDYRPPKVRGKNGARLNDQTRAKIAELRERRERFFASL